MLFGKKKRGGKALLMNICILYVYVDLLVLWIIFLSLIHSIILCSIITKNEAFPTFLLEELELMGGWMPTENQHQKEVKLFPWGHSNKWGFSKSHSYFHCIVVGFSKVDVQGVVFSAPPGLLCMLKSDSSLVYHEYFVFQVIFSGKHKLRYSFYVT